MNEEEVKVKYVVPWLSNAGIDVRNLQFERTFLVKLGRHSIVVGGSPRDDARARLDILVRHGDRNLLVVDEVPP